jgi:DNA modification methylase
MLISNRILYGSALHKLRELDSEIVDCCVTSPLYWSIVAKRKTEPQTWDPINGKKWVGELGLEPSLKFYIAHLMTVFDEVKRVLKPQGSCSVIMGDIYIKKCLSLVPEKFAMAMVEKGWILRSKIIWQKSKGMTPAVGKRFSNNWESVYWFTKSKKYYFGKDCNGYNMKSGHLNGSVWMIPNDKRPKHYVFPNFPRKLAKILICKTSPTGGLVLDPFMGSGTTALVALETSRRYLGVEVSRDSIDLALKRIKSEWKRN